MQWAMGSMWAGGRWAIVSGANGALRKHRQNWALGQEGGNLCTEWVRGEREGQEAP